MLRGLQPDYPRCAQRLPEVCVLERHDRVCCEHQIHVSRPHVPHNQLNRKSISMFEASEINCLWVTQITIFGQTDRGETIPRCWKINRFWVTQIMIFGQMAKKQFLDVRSWMGKRMGRQLRKIKRSLYRKTGKCRFISFTMEQ